MICITDSYVPWFEDLLVLFKLEHELMAVEKCVMLVNMSGLI